MTVFGEPFGAILFDMDGTILTSIPAVERAWTAWAQRTGAPVAEVLHYMHGRTAADTVARFAPPGADLAAEVAWIDARELADTGGIAPIAGADALLRALPAARWAVVTSANRALARLRIAAAGLPDPPLLVPSDDVARGKPDPEGYLRAAAALGVPAGRCLVVEDTLAGLRAGLAAGARVLHMLGTPGVRTPPGVPAIADFRGLAACETPAGIALVPAAARDGGA